MRKLKEVCRLKFELGCSNRAIAKSVDISPGTVSEYTRLFKITGLNWTSVSHLDEESLRQLINQHPTGPVVERPKPDWDAVHLELKRKSVTLLLLWKEYKDRHPDGLGYTQFSKLYRAYAATLDPVMRFNHKCGEKTFVDYSGLTMEWIDTQGEIHEAEIFVGCLGASHLIYAEATASQTLPDWIASHVRMFEFYGGVTEILVPDNLKSGVTKAHRYDPDVNATFTLLAEHYGIAVIPTRIVSPRDKAKVEVAVQCVEREIIAPLRHHTFTNLHEINEALSEKLMLLNQRPMQGIKLSRIQQFEQFEKQTLKPLPKTRFELQEWNKAKVHMDYHIAVHKHFYSVPHRLIGKRVDVCITKTRLEIFYQSERVALHQRDDHPYRFTTLEDHMPPKHQHYLQEQKDASVIYLMSWAKQMGEASAACVEKFFQTRTFPQQAIRAVLGLKRLAGQFGQAQFEEACGQTLQLKVYRLQAVEAILKKTKASKPKNVALGPEHFRGASYYQ